jgi:hypothetical protein
VLQEQPELKIDLVERTDRWKETERQIETDSREVELRAGRDA